MNEWTDWTPVWFSGYLVNNIKEIRRSAESFSLLKNHIWHPHTVFMTYLCLPPVCCWCLFLQRCLPCCQCLARHLCLGFHVHCHTALDSAPHWVDFRLETHRIKGMMFWMIHYGTESQSLHVKSCNMWQKTRAYFITADRNLSETFSHKHTASFSVWMEVVKDEEKLSDGREKMK